MAEKKELKPVGLHRGLVRAAGRLGPSADATESDVDYALTTSGLDPKTSTRAAVRAIDLHNRFMNINISVAAHYASCVKPKWGGW